MDITSYMKNLINRGEFGNNSPVAQSNYGLQTTHMESGQQYQYNNGGYYQYSQYNQQPQYYNNPYQNNGYGYNQQPYYNNGYGQQQYGYTNGGYNNYQQQPYYNNGYKYNQQQYGYGYNNGYNRQPYGYGGGYYNDLKSRQEYLKELKRQEENERYVKACKLRFYKKPNGERLTEEEIDRIVNRDKYEREEMLKRQRRISDEERIREAEWQRDVQLYNSLNRQEASYTPARAIAAKLAEKEKAFHEKYDNCGLVEMINRELPLLMYEQWLEKNKVPDPRCDLSRGYSRDNYNELLNMHNNNGSRNPFTRNLLDNSKYDNNTNDVALGMNLAFDEERKRRNLLEDKVPQFISSEEVQERRHRFTNAIMQQLYQKQQKGVSL